MVVSMVDEIIKFLCENWNGILIGIIVSAICGCCVWTLKKTKKFTTQSINDLLNNVDYNSRNWKNELDTILDIKGTVERCFPEYKEYLLIQYGSSVIPNNSLPSDYDFIVLLLGFPSEGNRYMHNKGTISNESNESNKDQVDIVFRDYLSFLFAASAGMPYENSVITNGKLIKGREGYFKWLKNITKNILFDRDFLISRFNDKIVIEKQEFLKCLNEHEKYEHDQYYVIRSGYYYITSILQLHRINKFEKVVTQNQIVELSKVRIFYDDFQNKSIKNKYIQLVENLKRNSRVESINIEDINAILEYIGGSDD